jgi:hypothetical protein
MGVAAARFGMSAELFRLVSARLTWQAGRQDPLHK